MAAAAAAPGAAGGGAAAPTAVSRLASPSGTTSSRMIAPHPSGGLPSEVFAAVHEAMVPSELSSSCEACELPPPPTPPTAVFTPPPTAADEPAEKSNAPTVSAVTTWVALLQSGPCSSSARTTRRSDAYRPTIDMSTSSSPARSSFPSSRAAPSGMFA